MATIKFGPEWLRNSMEGNSQITSNTASPPPSAISTNQQKNTGGASSTSNQAGLPRFQLAEYRYGREEMLALFDKDLDPPQELKDFECIFVERGHSPFALKSVNYEEEQLQPPSTLASRPWPRAPVQTPRPGTLTGEATRGGRGRGRPHTSAVTAVPAMYSQTQRWSETSNWRRHVVKGEEEYTEEVWRPSESPGTTAGAPAMRYPVAQRPSHNEKWDRDWPNDRAAARSSWHASRRIGSGENQNSDDLLPEWALEGNFTEGGTFDSHGAFHGTTDDIPSSRPVYSETAYGLTRSLTSGNIRPKEDTTGHWWVDYHQNKHSPAKREEPKKTASLPTGTEQPVVTSTTQNYKKLVSPFTEVVKKKKSNDDSSSSSDAEMAPFVADMRAINLGEDATKVKRFYDKQSQKAEININKTNSTLHKPNNKERVDVDKENGGDAQEIRKEYRMYHTQKESNIEMNNETKKDEPNIAERIKLNQKYYDEANKAAVAKHDIKRANSMYEVETKQEPLNVIERESTLPINMTMIPPPNFIPNMAAVPNHITGQSLPNTVNPPPGSLPNVYMAPSQQQFSMYQVQQLQQMHNVHQANQTIQKPTHNVQLPTQTVQPVQNLQQPVKIAQQLVQNTQLNPNAQLMGPSPQQLGQNTQLSPSTQLMGQSSQQMGQNAQKVGQDVQFPGHDAQNSLDRAEVPEWKRSGWTVPQTRDCPDAWFYEDPLKRTQGPFTSLEMLGWFHGGFFKEHLMVRRANETEMRYLGSFGCVPPFVSDVAQGRAGNLTLDPNFQSIIDSVSRQRIVHPSRPEPSSSLPSYIPAFSGTPIMTSVITDGQGQVAVPPTVDTQILQPPAASALPRPSIITDPLSATADIIPQTPPGVAALASRPTPIVNMAPQLGVDRTMPYSSNVPTQRIVVPQQHMLPKPMFPNMKQRPTSMATSVNGSSNITTSSNQEPPSSGFMRQMSSVPISTVESLWAQQTAFPWTGDLTPTPKPTSMWGDIRPTPSQQTPNIPKAELKMDHHTLEERLFADARAQHLAGLSSGTIGFGQHDENISHSTSSLMASLNKTEKETKVERSAGGIPIINLPSGVKLQHVAAIEAQVLERSKLENYNKFKPKLDEIPRLEAIESQSQRLMSAVVGQAHPDMMRPNQFIQPDDKLQSKGKSDSVSPSKQTKSKASKEDKKEQDKKADEEKKTKRKVEEASSALKTKKETDKPKKETEKERKELAEKLAREGFIEVRSSSENRQNKDKRKNEIVKEMEQKKKEEEKKAQEEMLRRQADALKKMQQAQELQSKQEQHLHQNQLSQHIQQTVSVQVPARKAPWSAACNREGPALAEIQRLEREKKLEQIKEQQLMEQLMAQQQQVAMVKEQESQVGWANKSLGNKSSVKSLAEIQAEEARLAQAALVSREAQAREDRAKMPPQEPTAVPWMQPQTLHNGGEQRVKGERQRTADVGGFWDGATSVTTKQEQPKATAVAAASPVLVPTVSRTEAKKRAKAVKETQEQKDTAALTQFDTWSSEALSKWSSMIDVPTFLGFLKDIESPYEIKEYVKCYLGDSKETADFARQFLEKRYRMLRTSAPVDDLCSPAPALSPVLSSESQELKNKVKKTKKNKMQKVDIRILGFSVTASEDRINVGDIDSV